MEKRGKNKKKLKCESETRSKTWDRCGLQNNEREQAMNVVHYGEYQDDL